MMDLQGTLIASGRQGRMLGIAYSSSGGLPESRNSAVRNFLAGTDEWLFWIDTDMGFQPDALERLLTAADPQERPVVGGLCFTNVQVDADGMGGYTTFPIPTVYRWAKNPDGTTGFVSWHDYPRDELYRCDATGSAFVLVHRTVFERLYDKHGENWYTPIPNPAGGGSFGEDMSFCVQCAELEIPIYVDTSVKTTHHKPVWLSEQHFDMYRQAAASRGIDSQVASGGAKPRQMNRAERRAAAKAS